MKPLHDNSGIAFDNNLIIGGQGLLDEHRLLDGQDLKRIGLKKIAIDRDDQGVSSHLKAWTNNDFLKDAGKFSHLYKRHPSIRKKKR